MNIAILSPSKSVYSETFIQQHKERLKGKIFYYYDGFLPNRLEGHGNIKLGVIDKVVQKVKRVFKITNQSDKEYALLRSFQDNKINVVLAEYGVTANYVLNLCIKLKLPLITHFHGFDASRNEVLKKYNNFKNVFEYSSYIIVVSKKMFIDFTELGCPMEKLVYNVYGPKEEFFNIYPNFSNKQFISIGRFVDKKAPYYLILAFKEVVLKHPDAKLVIAGDGKLFNACYNLIKFYNLEESILLVGVITPDKFQKYLKESYCYIQHSLTALDGDSEGTPVAILEASAAGLPIISTKHAGIVDVIEDGINGLLTDEHDVGGMINNILSLIDDPLKAIEMGKKGKENIKKNFSLQRHISKLDELIKNVSI